MLRKQLNRSPHSMCSCLGDIIYIASVMVFGRPQIPCIGNARPPRASYCRGFVNDGFTPRRCKRVSVPIVWAIESFIHQNVGIESCFFAVNLMCFVPIGLIYHGNSLTVVARAAMNASLNVWIALSARLTRWLCGSTTYKSQSFFVRNFLIYFVVWLSMTFILGL